MTAAVSNAFAELGVMAWEQEVLPEALELLSVRLDLAGAGPLLDDLMRTRWRSDRDDSGGVILGHKGNPTPDPKPPPPPPPPPPGK